MNQVASGQEKKEVLGDDVGEVEARLFFVLCSLFPPICIPWALINRKRLHLKRNGIIEEKFDLSSLINFLSVFSLLNAVILVLTYMAGEILGLKKPTIKKLARSNFKPVLMLLASDIAMASLLEEFRPNFD